jgi:hypothetical protein
MMTDSGTERRESSLGRARYGAAPEPAGVGDTALRQARSGSAPAASAASRATMQRAISRAITSSNGVSFAQNGDPPPRSNASAHSTCHRAVGLALNRARDEVDADAQARHDDSAGDEQDISPAHSPSRVQ